MLLVSLVMGLSEILWASTPSNEAFLKKVAVQNWLKLERRVPALKTTSVAIVAADSTNPIGRLVAAHFREIVFRRNKQPVFARAEASSQWLMQTWVTQLTLDFTPLKTRWLHSKKWVRQAALENRFEIVDQKTQKLIWSGTLSSMLTDTLTNSGMISVRANSPSFLQGTLVEKKSSLWKAMQIAFLVGISVAIVEMFYTIRTS